jgi:Zn-dependent protease
MLLKFPVVLLQIAIYTLWGLADVLRGRKRVRTEKTVLIKAPRDVVWRFVTADHLVFDGPPVMELITEPLPEGEALHLTRVLLNGQEWGRVVARYLECDEAAGTMLSQVVPHPLTHPPELANDCLGGLHIEARPEGTLLTIFNELTVHAFRERINYPVGVAGRATNIKAQCEKEAQPPEQRAAQRVRQGAVLSFVALMSFWYLFGWQDALLLAAIVVLHEAGHAAAMRMVGMKVQGIYLVPFFGGMAVPKTAYGSQGHRGFVALMGPGFSLIPTFGLVAIYGATGELSLLHAVSLFAFINAFNLLPVYPLDGGLIVDALLGSLSRRLSRHLSLAWAWTGLVAGFLAAFHFQSVLIGIPVLVFGLQLYLSGGRRLDLKRLSFAGAAGLILAFAAVFALHALAFIYAETAARVFAAGGTLAAMAGP